MKERFAEVPTKSGAMKTFVTHPEQDGPFPAVILFMDFWGVRDELLDIARWTAVSGYCCVVPDFYYRQGTVRNERHDAQGKMVSLSRLDPTTQASMLAPLERFSDTEAMDDTESLLQFLADHSAVRAGPKGSFGYCLGGRLVMRAATRFPEQFRASASLHGSALMTDRKDSPHRSVSSIAGEFYCGFAEHDPYTPPGTVGVLASAMQASKGRYHHEVHRGAEHGYALPNRDIHDKKATLRDWEIIMAMFRRQLSGRPISQRAIAQINTERQER
jgi:carboxymethylenebutenolidase